MSDDHSGPMAHGAFVAIYSVVNRETLLLLGQRNTRTKSYPRWLELAGGTVEEGEGWLQGVAREVQEETGMAVETSQLTPFAQYRREDQPDALLHAAVLRVHDLTVRNSDEWLGYVWVDVEQAVQLHDMILPAHLRIIVDVLSDMGMPMAWNTEHQTAWTVSESYIRSTVDQVDATTT